MVAGFADATNKDQEWPSLNRRQDEWEILEQDVEEDETNLEPKEDAHSFEVIIESDVLLPPMPTTASSNMSTAGSRTLRHCSSLPSLSSQPDGTTASQLDGADRQQVLRLGSVLEDEEESSYAMVSGPPSVWTSPTTGSLNFRDAILSSSASLDESGGYLPTAAAARDIVSSPIRSSNNNNHNSDGNSKKSALRKFQPRFVVVPTPPRMPARRCSLSTGDLPSLLILDEQGDANEFYQQKSMATSSYSVGRKLRPDEAKRRTLIIEKKERQRQGNQ